MNLKTSTVHIVSYPPGEPPRPEPTSEQWLERAREYRRYAAHWRRLVEREESDNGAYGDGYGRLPGWSDLKATILEYIGLCERDAEDAERRSGHLRNGS
jgi:hypothetical protein